jgi:hypothetical protein
MNNAEQKLCECGCGKCFASGKTAKGKEKRFISGHNLHIDGKSKLSMETRDKISKQKIKYYSDPENRKKLSEIMMGHAVSEEARKNMSKSIRKHFEDPDNRKKHIIRQKIAMSNPAARENNSIAQKIAQNRPEVKKKRSESLMGRPLSDSQKESIGKASKMAWSNKNEYDKGEWVKNILSGKKQATKCSPNKAERKLSLILNAVNPNEWKFVGDGQVIISGKCPDFININGQKKIVELFGDYWHKGQNPQDRIDTFAPFGYETLVVWERELKNKNVLIEKIKVFSGAKL